MKLFIFAALPLFAQIAPDQLRTTPDAPTQLWAGTSSGFVPVRIGSGIVVQVDATGFTITAAGATLPAAIDAAYRAAAHVKFDGMQFRTDIGKKGLRRW